MSNAYKINAAGGLRIPVVTSDPSSPENGSIWYNSTSNTFKRRENGVTSTFSSGNDILDIKQSVRAATTTDANLSEDFEEGDVIDGVTLAAEDRVLIKNQINAAENGIYTVNSSGSPTRATDADSDTEVTAGMFTFVEEGTVNADSGWVLISDNPLVLDTDDLNFTQFTGLGQITAGSGLSKTGNTLNVNVDDSTLEINSDTVRQKDDGTTNAKLANMAAWTLKIRNAGTTGDPSDAALADITTEGTPASGDFAIGFLDTGEIRKFDLNALPISAATQTALNGKASTALSNLASVAINTSLVSDTDNTDDLGSQAINWKDVHAKSLQSTNGLLLDADSNAGGDRANALNQVALKVARGKQSSAMVEEEYIDSSTLADNTTAVVAAFTFAHASYNALEITYLIREATSLETRKGRLSVTTDGTTTSITDDFNEVGDPGITWAAAVNGANVELSYTTTSTGNARTMRSDLKRFRAI